MAGQLRLNNCRPVPYPFLIGKRKFSPQFNLSRRLCASTMFLKEGVYYGFVPQLDLSSLNHKHLEWLIACYLQYRSRVFAFV